MEKEQKVCYESMEMKAMKKSTRYSVVVFAVIFVVCGILNNLFYCWFAGILLGLAMLFEKRMYVTEQGIEMDYRLIVKMYRDIWSFEEIEAIYREPSKEEGIVALNVMKGLSGKRLIFSKETAEKVLQIALTQNPEIDYNAKA